MSKSQLFYDRHQIGTNLIGMPENTNSGGAAQVMGLDREISIAEKLNSNFQNVILGMVSFHNPAWTQRSFNKVIYSLNRELRRFRARYGAGWLCWVNGQGNTTTTQNTETAGSNVVIDVVSVATLDIQVGDYVLVIPPDGLSPLSIESPAQVLEVTNVGAGAFTAATLGTDLPSGSTVYRVLAAWEDAVFTKCDTGTPPEQAADFYRFQTSWEFITPSDPVLSVSE